MTDEAMSFTHDQAVNLIAVVDAINRDGRRPAHLRVHSSRVDAWRRVYFWRFSFAHKLATSLGWGTR